LSAIGSVVVDLDLDLLSRRSLLLDIDLISRRSLLLDLDHLRQGRGSQRPLRRRIRGEASRGPGPRAGERRKRERRNWNREKERESSHTHFFRIKKKKQAKEKKPKSSFDPTAAAGATAAAVLTTRREALSLYRSIWRATALFTWSTADAKGAASPSPMSCSGEPWRDALRRSARQEFEASRFERDPVMVARMLVVGRDAVTQAVDKLAAKAAEVERGLRGGGGGGGEGGGGGGGGGGERR